MSGTQYRLLWSRTAKRAIAETLPEQVALVAFEFITERLALNPQRLGKALGAELSGIYTARLAPTWRVLYEIDDAQHLVTVLDIRPRTTAYRRR